MRVSRSIGAICGLAITTSVFAQCDPEWAQDGPVSDGFYGWGTANLGDLDGDGLPEIVSQFNNSTSGETGHVFTSALDGAVLSTCNLCGYWGFTAHPLGDIDGDGIAEWLKHTGSGVVAMLSGFDTQIWSYSGEDLGATTCGDLDGDAITDFAIGDPWPGTTTIYSGATQTEIASFSGVISGGIGVGDLSGDGINDAVFAIGMNELRVISGADFSTLYTISGQGHLGRSMAAVGDVDGDGAVDFVLADPLKSQSGVTIGRVVLVSGATGAFLVDELGTQMEPIDAVYPAGDWNLDGVLDLVVSCPGADYQGINAGRVSFRSGDDLRIIDRFDGTALGDNLQGTPALVEGLPGQIRPAIVIAETNYTGNMTNQGRINLSMSRCRADFNCDEDVNSLDVLAFLNAWSTGSFEADANFDNEINTLDVLAFLAEWAQGC